MTEIESVIWVLGNMFWISLIGAGLLWIIGRYWFK